MFANGLFCGLASAAVVVQVWFAVLLAPLRETYADFGDADIPTLTHVMVHPAWLWGTPVVGALLVAALIWRRPARRGPYAASAALLGMVAAATFVLAQTPIHALAEIKAEPVMQLVPVGP